MIEKILQYLHEHEIDYRLESNFCCGYIFYFLDGSVYPRRYYDTKLEGIDENIICESVEHILEKATSMELVKDWRYRIEGSSLENVFNKVKEYLLINTIPELRNKILLL